VEPGELVVDAEVLRRFDRPGPRYTSYPTADRFVEAFDATAYQRALETRRTSGRARGLSLYVHLPFCSTICYYCACNKVITKDRARSAKYVRYVGRELDLVGERLGPDERVGQLHWGGGTPTFLPPDDLRALMGMIARRFPLMPEGEYSIEVDPRSASPETIALLAELGFNRLSVGVQDFDEDVQRAVNRRQSFEETAAVIEAARAHGFKSVNLDLIYGLPRQDPGRMGETLAKVQRLAPDRIALYNYAHLPGTFKPQRRIAESELPSAAARIDLAMLAMQTLTAAGYRYIGMDHFALPDDELAQAQRLGHLHRNFQGYSTRAECDLVGLGISAIGAIGPAYSQNVKTLEEYYDRLDRHELPVMRGIELSADDLVRRAVIQALMCHFELAIESIEIAYLVDFERYFAAELADLRELGALGLVEIGDGWITVTPRGRLVVRGIAMVFDRYLRLAETRARYSKLV
jgi:oxygen-independent coproporphyrinogen-3 oxidase